MEAAVFAEFSLFSVLDLHLRSWPLHDTRGSSVFSCRKGLTIEWHRQEQETEDKEIGAFSSTTSATRLWCSVATSLNHRVHFQQRVSLCSVPTCSLCSFPSFLGAMAPYTRTVSVTVDFP